MPPVGQHHHRAGSLRQSNKKNKRSNASKRSLARSAGGKVESSPHPARSRNSATSLHQQSKANRRNQQQQRRDARRQELLRKKRGGLVGSATAAGATASDSALPAVAHPPPPRVVGIISLGPSLEIEEEVRECLASSADRTVRLPPENGTTAGKDEDGSGDGVSCRRLAGATSVTCKYSVHKKDGQLTFLTSRSSTLPSYEPAAQDTTTSSSLPSPETASLLAALDLARICDVLLLVIDGNGPRLDRDVTEIQIEGGDRGESTKSGNNRTGPDYDHLVSSRGDRILAALKGQGLPTPITVLAHSSSTHPDNDGDYDDDHDGDELMTFRSVKSRRRSAIKRKLELKKYVSRFATTEFGTNNDRVAELFLANMTAQQYDTGVNADVATASSASSYTGSAAALVRTLCFLRCGPPKWVSECPRSYLLADSVRHDAATQHLHLTGYLRGAAPLNVNSLVHVPNLGTFAIHSVAPAAATAPPLSRRYRPPAPLAGGGGRDNEMEAMNANADISKKTLFSDPVRQESVNMFASPDALEGEQNLVGFDDEDMEGNGPREEEDEDPAPRPAGWSDYQAAWLDAVDDDGDDDGDKGAVDRGELARELNRKETRVTEAPTVPRSDATMATGMEIDLDDANDVNVADKETMLEHRRKEQKENVDFPDEVQVEADQIASERFARYRSLKSFRKSFWDPKENLPATYASIYHFSNFRATQRSILRECKETIRAAERTGCFWGRTPPLSDEEGSNAVAMEEEDTSEGICDDDESAVPANDEDLLLACVPTGSYVTVTLHDVQVAPRSGALVTAVSLLPHENKVSVLHMAVSRHNDNNESSDSALVKSKDVVTFRCGWRTWQGRPVFSQLNLNCDKHPLERFLPSFGAASVFGPVTYTPAPVLMFVGDQVVGMGSVVSADADRLVLKRIVLTGYPVKVHKRHAVVKYMFYNPGDVQWFQPAGLYTKHGLQGNIISSVGEHGTMKCLFHAPIKQHDTVCLPLYKRVYPKFVEQRSDADNAKVGSARYSLTVR